MVMATVTVMDWDWLQALARRPEGEELPKAEGRRQ
jgi:hypothetical protein